ncbi:MAG TPA: hypothetical protein VN962_10885, partial [Polyangia bacterium]|nr:hypothetical protein [Polyangia bacterium]
MTILAVAGGWGGPPAASAADAPAAPRGDGEPQSIPLARWELRAVGGPPGFGDWIPAAVPGCVHTDLLRA